jgi:hypothetical protein
MDDREALPVVDTPWSSTAMIRVRLVLPTWDGYLAVALDVRRPTPDRRSARVGLSV